MLSHIPTHLIAGPLGAGKTSLIHCLLRQKPAGERWAVLINEFGLVGLDAALLHGTDVSLAEIPGGCLCCVNGVPFQVGLARLLRQARPDRLFIEPSGLGHPDAVLAQLGKAPWQEVLALQPAVVVLDAAALARGTPLASSQTGALEVAGLLLLNKSEGLDLPAREGLLRQLPAVPHHWTEHGQLALAQLPGIACKPDARPATAPLPQGPSWPGTLWSRPDQPLCQAGFGEGGWSIGWRWHPTQGFDLEQLRTWLRALPWKRAKLVVQTATGAYSANALAGGPLTFKPSEWRKDSRVELIFDDQQDVDRLSQALASCRAIDQSRRGGR